MSGEVVARVHRRILDEGPQMVHPSVVAALAEQAATVDYVHATQFAAASLEAYADALAPVVPVDDVRVFPVSGGSEANETALKLARSYHLARGEDRHLVVAHPLVVHKTKDLSFAIRQRRDIAANALLQLGQHGLSFWSVHRSVRCLRQQHGCRSPTAECALVLTSIHSAGSTCRSPQRPWRK